MRPNEATTYKAQRARTIAADARHTEMMQGIADRAGMTLAALRALPESKKAQIMREHRA